MQKITRTQWYQRCALLILLSCECVICARAVADEIEADHASPAAAESGHRLAEIPNYPAFFRLDYSGDWPNTPGLTGDWGGVRTELANNGISFNIEVLQTVMGNAYGGKQDGVEYFGSADYTLQLDTYRMDLWPGGYFKFRGETAWGRNANQDSGAISNPNYDALFPAPNDPGLTTLTEAWYLQALGEKLYVLGGKIDLSRLPGQNVFASDYYGQFMNTSLWQNPVVFSTIPYTSLGAGIGYKPAEWMEGATLVLDSHGSPTRSGFDSAFGSPSGLSLVQSFTFRYKLGDLPGTQRLMGSWSTRQRVALEDLDRLLLSGASQPSFSRLDVPQSILLPGGELNPRRFLLRSFLSNLLEPEAETTSWMFTWDFDQYVYQEDQDPSQGVGVFGRFGWSPGKFNPVKAFYSVGLGGTGLLPNRDRDRFGLGYYYLDLSNDFPGIFRLGAEQGIELFYNIEVFPWLHITPDIQVIVDPGGRSLRDPAIVYGIRTQMSF
jgi:porin